MDKLTPMELTDDKDYIVVDGGVWLTIKGFSVRVYETDEGVVCDMWKAGEEDEESIGSTYAFDAEIEDEGEDEC